MARRARPPWWRVIDWRVVLAVGVPVWYAAGAVVVICEVKASSRPTVVRQEAPFPPPRSPGTAPPVPPARPPAAPALPDGFLAWYAITTAVTDPRLLPGIPAGAHPGPFAARLINGGGKAEPGQPGQVWRRAGGDGRPGWNGPPAAIDGFTTLGTHVPWRASPDDAMDRAAAEGKLAYVLHTSGGADEGWFTDSVPATFRSRVLSDREAGQVVAGRFVAALQKVVTVRSASGPKPPGAVVSYFCTPDGRVVHAVPGFVPPAAFAAEAHWAANLAVNVDPVTVRIAHRDRLKQFYGLSLPVDLAPGVQPGPAPAVVLADPGVAALDGTGRVHALLAANPLPRLGDFYPVVWDKILAGGDSAGRPARK